MIAGILNLSGIYAGQTVHPDKSYTATLYENQRMRQLVTQSFKENVCDPDAQFPLPTAYFLFTENFRSRCFGTILREREGKQGQWFYKDNRLPLVWQEMNKIFPSAKWVVVLRDDNSILKSCEKTGFMKAFSKSYILQQIGKETAIDGWKWWLQQYKDRIMEMQYSLNMRIIYPEKMMHGNYEEIKSVVGWCGGVWKEKETKDFIQPKLRRV
jgi:hypothetical protein